MLKGIFTTAIFFCSFVQCTEVPKTFNKEGPVGTPSFRVCGNYCGPGWCDGKYILEENCDDR